MSEKTIYLNIWLNGYIIFSLEAWQKNAMENTIQLFHSHEKDMAIGDDLRVYSSDGSTRMLLAQRVKEALLC